MGGTTTTDARSWAVGGRGAAEIDPATFNAVRFCLAAGAIGTLVMVRGGIARTALVAPWRYLLLGGLYGAYFVAMFEGLKTAPPVSSAAVFTLTPVMAAGFGYILLRQRLTLWMSVALAIGAAGALWVIFRADLAALLAFELGPGEAIFFWGCVAHAAYAPAVRWLNRTRQPRRRRTWRRQATRSSAASPTPQHPTSFRPKSTR